MATQLVARGIQQLDKVLHDGGHIIRLRAGRLDQGRHGCDQRHTHGLWPLAAVDHGELHAGAFAQGGHAIRQSRCGQEHVLASSFVMNPNPFFASNQRTRPLGMAHLVTRRTGRFSICS